MPYRQALPNRQIPWSRVPLYSLNYTGCMNYFVLSTKQSWSQAKAACEAKGAKLAQLSTPTEVENAAKKIQDKTHYWIGGHCPGCRPQ